MDKNSILDILIKTDPFELLGEDVLSDLAEKISLRKYSKNTFIFKQGDPSQDSLFIIESGLMEISIKNDRGSDTVIGLRRRFDFFGETVVLSQQRYPATARVKEDLSCLLIPRRELETLIYNHPDFSGFFNTLLAERMRLLYEDIVAEQSFEAYSSVESPLFRKKVSEIMTSAVITCHMDDRAAIAAGIMSENSISAIVALDNAKRPRGILTENHLVKHLIVSRTYDVETCRVKEIMSSNPVQTAPESFLGQALVAMIRSKTKYLIVMERGDLVGIISMSDLIRTRSTGTLLLTHDIESQTDMEGLSHISNEINNILNALIAEKAAVPEIFEVMSELHERLSRRAVQLAEERMRLEGYGPAPVEWCFINMGSAARYEQTLRTDQDNAIIYDDPRGGDEENVDDYFSTLAGFIIQGLAQCGFEKCSGGVMATNKKWRKPYSQWINGIDKWIRSYDPEDTRILTILLDFRPLWGDASLAEKLREKIFDAFHESLAARHMLAKDDLLYKLPVSFLGKFITERTGKHKNQMDLKRSAAQHIVNGIRLFAVKNRISEASTFGRLEQLEEKGAISADDADFFRASFETLMMFRIRENIKKSKQGFKADNYIDPNSLRKQEKIILKDALSGVAHLQKLVNSNFNVIWLQNLV